MNPQNFMVIQILQEFFHFSPGKMEGYKPTGLNDHFQYLNVGSTAFVNGVGQGGQLEHFTWFIHYDFEKGECKGEKSSTFGCPLLTKETEWTLDLLEAWELSPPVTTGSLGTELAKIRSKKGHDKSVLADDDNADKAILGMTHEFSSFKVEEESGKKLTEEEQQKRDNYIPSTLM